MSRTIGGLVAVLVGLLMQWLGAPVADAEAGEMAEQIIAVVGLLVSVGGTFWAWRARAQRGDVSKLGVRKGPEAELKAAEKLVAVAEQKVDATQK